MAARTASVSGDWSNTATWGGAAVPVDGDTITINSSVVVDFDVDQSGFASGLGASTVNGTLRAKRTAGAKYLKMNGTLTISTTGTLDASDGSGGAYRSDASFTILLNGNFSITVSGSGVVNLICGEPTHKYVKLSQAESSAATTLHVDTDVSGEALWAGALIRIDNINAAAQSEERTVSGTPTSTVITITAGLTNSKLQGAYVILVTRNVKILGASTASGTGIFGGIGNIIAAEIRNIAVAISGATSGVIGGTLTFCVIGGTISNTGTVGVTGAHGSIINASLTGHVTAISGSNGVTVNGIVSGCTSAGLNLSNSFTLTGIVAGCVNGIASGVNNVLLGATVIGCTTGITTGGGWRIINSSFSANTRDIGQTASGQLFNTLLGSTTEFLSYSSVQRSIFDYLESFDHDQVAGAFRAWTMGGITSSVASPVFDASRARSYNIVLENAVVAAFFQRQALVPPGGSVYVRCYVQKDASMSYLPRIQVFSAEKEPLVSGSADAEVQMTNSTNTWEVLEATVTNTTDSPKLYTVRCLAKNASGNVYFDPIIRTSAMMLPVGQQGGLAA